MVCAILINRESVKGQEIIGKRFLLHTFTEYALCWEAQGAQR